MPAYVWICQVCATSNEAGGNVCARCSAPAELNSIEIAQRRRALGLDANAEPQPGPIRRQIAKCRIWLPAIYVVVVVLAGLPVSLLQRRYVCNVPHSGAAALDHGSSGDPTPDSGSSPGTRLFAGIPRICCNRYGAPSHRSPDRCRYREDIMTGPCGSASNPKSGKMRWIARSRVLQAHA